MTLPLVLGAAALLLLTVGISKLEGGAQAAANAALGLAALWVVRLTAAYTGIHLGFNLFNAAVAGVLGVPGVMLLALAQWVLL